jgi:hypothetical protein
MTANNETAPKDFNKTRFGVETNLLFINDPGAYGVAVSNMIEGFGPSIKRLNSDRS